MLTASANSPSVSGWSSGSAKLKLCSMTLEPPSSSSLHMGSHALVESPPTMALHAWLVEIVAGVAEPA